MFFILYQKLSEILTVTITMETTAEMKLWYSQSWLWRTLDRDKSPQSGFPFHNLEASPDFTRHYYDFRRENWESQAFENSLLTLFKIGVYFPYNIMLVSAVQRSELAICIRISCLSDLPFPHLSLLGHPKARSWALCAEQRLPPPAARFARPCTNASAPLSLCPAAFLHCVHKPGISVCLRSCPANRLTSTVLLTPYVGITILYLPFSSWLTSLCIAQPLSSIL